MKAFLIGTKMNHGGAQIELLEISKSLQSKNIQYKLIAGRGSLDLENELNRKNLNLIEMSRPMKLFEILSYFKMIFLEIKNERPSYIFCSGPIACYFGLFIGKLFGIEKRVYRVSGCTITSANSFMTNLRNYFLEKFTFFVSTHSYFVSIFNMHKYEKMGLKSKKNKSIPTIINFDNKKINRDSNLKIKFGYLGNLQKEKGIKVVLNSLKAFDSDLFELHIAGDGILVDEVEIFCNENDNYFYHGIAEPYSFLGEIDVLLMPTLYMEGLPQVISQAIVSSCVVIAYHHEGIPEEIIDGFNGFLTAKNIKSFEDSIEKLIFQPNLLRKMQENTVKLNDFIKQKHSGSILIEEIVRDISD